MKPNTKIADVELSVRSMEMLQQMNVTTLSDLSKLTREQILAHPNSSKLVLKELSIVLEEAGLEFRQ